MSFIRDNLKTYGFLIVLRVTVGTRCPLYKISYNTEEKHGPFPCEHCPCRDICQLRFLVIICR